MNSLHQNLNDVYNERADYFLHKHQRMLPFGDMIADRWEKAKKLGFGNGASIYDSAIVFGEVSVGGNTWVGPGVILDGSGARLVIGEYCSISAGTQIYTHDSVGWALTGGKQAYATGGVTIGNNIYIGPHTVISRGVTIGNCCIIGAHSLVNSDIPDNSVAWGCPARIVGKVQLDDSNNDFTITYD